MSQYVRPGSSVPVVVNDVILITTPSGTQELWNFQRAALEPQALAYEHTQGAVSNSWVINHNLGFKPNVTVVDSAGTIYEGEITYTNSNSLTVSFSQAFSGKAYLS
jgi:hypothetical protein